MKHLDSVLLDNSFVIRLLKSADEFHNNVVEYFEYFLDQNIVLYLSTIVISEYAVVDDPDHLLELKSFQILEFDYGDAKIAGGFFASLKDDAELRQAEERKVIINDLKLFAQIKNRGIDAFITKDRKALSKMISPLRGLGLDFEFIDLSIPLKDHLGRLF